MNIDEATKRLLAARAAYKTAKDRLADARESEERLNHDLARQFTYTRLAEVAASGALHELTEAANEFSLLKHTEAKP